MGIQIKRIYADVSPKDGYRILVDRLWPRGVSKEKAALDLWAKDIAPSPSLRTWFGHKPERFKEFSERYLDELSHNPEIKTFIADMRSHGAVTLLYGAKDPAINHAAVLQAYLKRKM